MDKNNRLDEDTIRKYSSEFGLTQEQVIEFNAEFKAYDTDRNGTICTEDLGVVNKAFGGNADENVLGEWIKESDTSGDGKVDFHEFLKFNAMSLKKKKDQDQEGFFCNEMGKEIRQVFRELDKDGNGLITSDELKHGMMSSLEKKIEAMINEADVDGDGHINFLEFEKVNHGPSQKSSIVVPPNVVEEPPRPPDGGWGWVIVFACFMCNLVVKGFGFSFGVLLKPLITVFESDRTTVSLVSSISTGITSIVGPIVGGLVIKFGLRPVCISGSIIAAIGFALAAQSNYLPLLILFFGIIGGIGSGLISLPAKIAIGYYFETKRALATGIAECGAGVGLFIFPQLATAILNAYDQSPSETDAEINAEIDQSANVGWKITLLVTAGLCLTVSIFGALMRPLEVKKEQVPGEKEPVNVSRSLAWGESQEGHTMLSPFSKMDLFYGGSVTKLMKNENSASTWNEFRSLLLTSQRISMDDKEGETEKQKKDESIWDMAKNMINLELLKDPRFLLFGICTFSATLGFFVPYVYLINMAKAVDGIDKEKAPFLISIIGIANIIGKLFTGWFTDLTCVNSFLVKNIFICLTGVSIILLPFCTAYWMFSVVAAMFGFFSSFVILRTIVLVELLGLEKLTSAFGLLALFEGTGALLGSPIAGGIYKARGNYDVPFYTAGGFFVLASLIGVVVQLLQRKKQKQQTPA